MLTQKLIVDKCKYINANKDLQNKLSGRILGAPDSRTVLFKSLALPSLSSQAIISPSPLMSAARCMVLFPGAAQASRTFK
jgi:hypothetical protein